MNSLPVNQSLQCMLQQMIPLSVEEQQLNVDSKLQCSLLIYITAILLHYCIKINDIVHTLFNNVASGS
jgi:hypothetical protein